MIKIYKERRGWDRTGEARTGLDPDWIAEEGNGKECHGFGEKDLKLLSKWKGGTRNGQEGRGLAWRGRACNGFKQKGKKT